MLGHTGYADSPAATRSGDTGGGPLRGGGWLPGSPPPSPASDGARGHGRGGGETEEEEEEEVEMGDDDAGGALGVSGTPGAGGGLDAAAATRWAPMSPTLAGLASPAYEPPSSLGGVPPVVL
jgi:hypothetical protein